MAHLRLNVSGMKGPACQKKVEQALLQLPGMWVAVVCLEDGYLDVEYADDNGPTVEDLLGAIARAGYSARLGG